MTLKYGPTFLMDKLRLSWHFVAASAAKQDSLSFQVHTQVCVEQQALAEGFYSPDYPTCLSLKPNKFAG